MVYRSTKLRPPGSYWFVIDVKPKCKQNSRVDTVLLRHTQKKYYPVIISKVNFHTLFEALKVGGSSVPLA